MLFILFVGIIGFLFWCLFFCNIFHFTCQLFQVLKTGWICFIVYVDIGQYLHLFTIRQLFKWWFHWKCHSFKALHSCILLDTRVHRIKTHFLDIKCVVFLTSRLKLQQRSEINWINCVFFSYLAEICSLHTDNFPLLYQQCKLFCNYSTL